MIQTKKFADIKNALTAHFGAPASPETLSTAEGSKTINEARLVGVLIAKRAGYTNQDIATAFGYSSSKSASNAFSKASKAFDQNPQFIADSKAVAEILSIHLGT